MQCLAAHSVLVYIEGTEAHLQTLVERFRRHPKPMYYPPAFLTAKWEEYLALTGAQDEAGVDPDGFAVWGFEQLLRHRLPRYAAIARNVGYAIRMEDLTAIRSDADFLDLLGRTIDQQPHGPRSLNA
jgi:hypothetical protein